jgi:hypothetical protein
MTSGRLVGMSALLDVDAYKMAGNTSLSQPLIDADTPGTTTNPQQENMCSHHRCSNLSRPVTGHKVAPVFQHAAPSSTLHQKGRRHLDPREHEQ